MYIPSLPQPTFSVPFDVDKNGVTVLWYNTYDYAYTQHMIICKCVRHRVYAHAARIFVVVLKYFVRALMP